MSKLNSAATTFPVADVDATIRWYETALGLTTYPFPENPPYVLAGVIRDDVEIMFSESKGMKNLGIGSSKREIRTATSCFSAS
jgi:catechol 2,3-dioxygenase-like lactoylglutathione lyase family enzyme